MTWRPADGRCGGSSLSKAFSLSSITLGICYTDFHKYADANHSYCRLSFPVIIYGLEPRAAQASVSIKCGSFPWQLDQGRIQTWWRRWQGSKIGASSEIRGQSPFWKVCRCNPYPVSWILLRILRSILPAFSYINAINMRKSHSVCYTYRRLWECITILPLYLSLPEFDLITHCQS